jgi:hypothetical protein
MSKSQDRLESASRAVTAACKSLVRQVQNIIVAKNRDEGEEMNWSDLNGHEFKVQEMEQQVVLPLLLPYDHEADVCYRSKFSSWRINYSNLGIDLGKCESILMPRIKIEALGS